MSAKLPQVNPYLLKITRLLSNFRFINNETRSNLFQKRYFRQRAHSNPFSDHYLE
jgi:hypothetical protein